MRKLLTLILIAGALLVVIYFGRQWLQTSPWGVGTGNIGNRHRGRATVPAAPGPAARARSQFAEITRHPTRYEDKQVSLWGRVRGPVKLASNRSLYTLTDGTDRIIVVDDRPLPAEFSRRTVRGKVKVIGPPVGGLQHAYILSARQGVRFNEPNWKEIGRFFTTRIDDLKKGFNEIS